MRRRRVTDRQTDRRVDVLELSDGVDFSNVVDGNVTTASV